MRPTAPFLHVLCDRLPVKEGAQLAAQLHGATEASHLRMSLREAAP